MSVDSGLPKDPSAWVGSQIFKSAAFFRVWVIYGSLFMVAWALYALHHLSWVAQPIYSLIIIWTYASSARDVCTRCAFYDTWHCGGAGKMAAQLAPPQQDAISLHQSQKHYALWTVTIAGMWVGLFHQSYLAGTLGVVWSVVAIATSIPAGRPYSWKVGRQELARRAEHPLRMPLAEDGAKTELQDGSRIGLGFSEGIDLIPLSPEDEPGGIESAQTKLKTPT